MYDITYIKNYILFLKNECGLSLTLHTTEEENLILPSELITFNIHDNSHCVYVKTSPSAFDHCVERQHKITEKCQNGSFCGVCYAGVREYIYPIKKDGAAIGFVCVSGYQREGGESYLRATAEKYGLSLQKLKETYASLKREMPEKERIDTLITPLCNMLELAYTRCGAVASKSLADEVIRYLKRYHTNNISLNDISAHFSCSVSLISHTFKRQTGKSIREYLTELRLEDAKSLLSHSQLTVTEIAFSTGFCDSNYFSNVFKKHVGSSPLAYRKRTAVPTAQGANG